MKPSTIITCIRSGGDEFVVLAKNYNQERASTFIANVRSYIEARVRSENKRYDVAVSVGVHIGDPASEVYDGDEYQVFSQYLKLADSAMYAEKRQHKSGRI